MESQQPSRYRDILIGLVILALAAPVYAAPGPEARVVLNSDRYVVGTRWSIDLLVDTPDSLSVKVPVPTLPPQLSLSDGPYIRETSWEKTPGVLSRATKVTFTFRTNAPGIVDVGPFEVRLGTQIQVLPAVTVYLLAADEAKRRFPVQLGWIVPDGPFYEGQAIPLILQAKNLDVLAQPQDPGLGAPAGALWDKVVGLGEIQINSIGEDRLMNIPWGGWMLIPTKAGQVTIPGFRGSVSGLDRPVPPLTLDVEAIPDEVAQSRAVGAFSYSVDAKEDSAQPGQLVVTQELSGQGNFPYLKLPDVAIPSLTLTSRQEGTRYRAGKAGYEGSLVVTWRFATDQARTITVTLPGFEAFQTKTMRIDRWDPRTTSVALHLPSGATEVASSARPLDWAGVQAVRPWGVLQGWPVVLFFLPGPLVLLGTFVLRGPGRGLLVFLVLGVSLTGASEGAPEGFSEALQARGAVAADQWAALAQAHPGEPGLWYNKALACRDAGRTAEAIQAFRLALRTGFQGDSAGRALMALEEKDLITDQFVPWIGWPTNWLFLGFCFAFNLPFGLWAAQRLSGAPGWVPPLAVAVLTTVVLGLVVAGAENARTEADAVIGLTDGPIRKVPGDLAETWMTLKAGTVVKVQGASDRWVLVQTGYGLEGWVQSSSLLPLSGGH